MPSKTKKSNSTSALAPRVTAALVSEEAAAKKASDHIAAIQGLRQFLLSAVEASASVRRDLADRIAEGEDAALSALGNANRVPRDLYTARYARQLLKEMSECDGDREEEIEVLVLGVRRMERWINSWAPDPGSPSAALHIAEYYAVRNILGALRAAKDLAANG